MTPIVLAHVAIVADELDPDGALIGSVRTRIGPALARAFDELEPDGSTCACCREVGIGVVLVGDTDKPTWRTPILVAEVNTGRSWAVCEDCGSGVLDPVLP